MTALLTPAELAERWKVSERSIQRLCARGELPAARLAGQWRIREEHAEAYEAAHRNGAAVPAAPASAEPVGAPVTSTGGFELPADYSPVFPELWGMEPETTRAASSAARRGGTAQRKRSARVSGN